LDLIDSLESNDTKITAYLSLKNLPDKFAGNIASGKALHEREGGYPFRVGHFDGRTVYAHYCLRATDRQA
jgi:hypothetical protein